MSNIEEGKTPLYSSLGGGRIGMLDYRGPLIRLKIYDEFLVIRYFFHSVVFRYDEIERVEVKKWFGLFPDRVQIFHRKEDLHRTLIIRTFNPDEVKALIEARLHQ